MFLLLNMGAKVALKVKFIYTISSSYYVILINCWKFVILQQKL